MIRTSKFLGAYFWCHCCYIVSFMFFPWHVDIFILHLILIFLTIENTIDYISWYNYQYKPTRKSPQSFRFIHSLSPFLLTIPYNLIILQPIYGSSWIHTIRFYITHWASSYIIAIQLLYHSKWLYGEFHFNFGAHI